MKSSHRLMYTLLLATSALPSLAFAQASSAPSDASAGQGEDIIITGTRARGVQAVDSAAPIQMVSEAAIERVGVPNLNQALTRLVPSFQAQTQGTDMASFSLSARLRGINPNHTLVMVNGKRRHGNSILQVVNSAFGGSAAPSIDLIPPDIVERIEILQDGAAAQYGSDAIAGVINIILKSDRSGGTIRSSVGQYYDGEGLTKSVSGNFALPVGENGFLDISLFHRWNDYTTLGEGQTTVRNVDGSTVRLTGANTRFQSIYDTLNARNGTANINGGQPKSELDIAFYNFAYDFGVVEAYSFGNVSFRHGWALQGYRPPNRICVAGTSASPTNPATCFEPTVTNGMVPLIEVEQDEFSRTGGLRGDIGGWNWDLSNTYAEDQANIYTTGSANASLWADTYVAAAQSSSTTDRAFTPRDFYDGSFVFTQSTSTLDMSKEFGVGLEDPLTFAFGAEYRKENYQILAGDDGSRYVEGGQSFPGYALSDRTNEERDAKAVYANVIVKPVSDWSIDIAGRYEDYSDFGDTTIGKITSRYDFTPAFAVRATASTGFRAPTMAESFYSATNVAPTSATIQLAPNSAGAASAGFSSLKPEKSTNYSAGFVVRPTSKLMVTLDGYFIKIDDRIVSSGQITGQRSGVQVLTPLINGQTPYALVTNAIAASGKQIDPTVLSTGTLSIQTYTNGVDTETVGAELAARYPIDMDIGRLDLTLGMNYNNTVVTENRLGSLFNAQGRSFLETVSPKFKTTLSALFTTGPFSANFRANYYSQSKQLTTPAINTTVTLSGGYYEAIVKPATIFDLELGYDITEKANFAIGANNLFDKKPQTPGLIPTSDIPAGSSYPNNGTSPYINGSTTINGEYAGGPYGSNGGYYYARLTYDF